MKKYLVTGIAAFALMITTVYALNDNNKTLNKSTTYNQNCPYYNETTHTYDCPNNKNGNYPNHHNDSRHGHRRQGGCHRHNQ